MSDAPEKQKFTAAKGLKNLPKMSSPGHRHKFEIHNEQFAKENQEFQTACQAAGVKPTARQASKFRNKKGRAFYA